MNTKVLIFAAIAAALGTVGVVTIQPAFASSEDFGLSINGDNSLQQQSDQSSCMIDCYSSQNLRLGQN
jgi:hypothetical protein